MFTYFGDNTVKSLFIKYFLSSNYQPMIRLYDRDNYYIKDFLYLKDNSIVRCVTRGDRGNATFRNVEPYLEGKFYPNINMKYLSRESTYDSNTHYYLGQFLRYIRDTKGIDLMPFYNCFNNDVFDNIVFYQNKLEISENNNADYEIALVPIKYNTTYYIYTHNINTLEVAYCFYNNGNMLKLGERYSVSFDFDNTKKTFSGISFKNPAIINTPDLISTSHPNDLNIENTPLLREIASSESNFYLGVKIPRNYDYSLVVLEGDYSLTLEASLKYRETVNYREINGSLNVKEIITNKYVVDAVEKDGAQTIIDTAIINTNKSPYKNLSPLSLIGWPITNKKVAFSDRLIEYLLLSVISPYDEIVDNIKRVQDYVKEDYTPQLKGKWDNTLTQIIFSKMKNVNQSPIGKLLFDINGYVDKDTEKVISRSE